MPPRDRRVHRPERGASVVTDAPRLWMRLRQGVYQIGEVYARSWWMPESPLASGTP